MKITLDRIGTGFSGDYCYTHARGMVAPDGFALITTQRLRLSGCDVFYGMEMLFSNDRGGHWSPIAPSANLVRQKLSDGCEQALCDATPMYHRATGKILLTGHDARYRDDVLQKPPRPRRTLWSVFDRTKMDFLPYRALEMPDPDLYFSCGSGCGLHAGERCFRSRRIPVEHSRRSGGSQH